ncbi:helix-turn-helix domain-containing protein [Thalassomonas viridans]|uniref:Helix-turn-helix domain-containing protein n=1 Tax=Thalassomonas viridans TaxID=137584 RepID=A0AAF0C5J1_9GAMM|nr:helix-turn-helix domain-containing protein [Thalassomonas viridans]WDE03402.1 helix-turn-helix domain-containing protein [Thalassomonas viridans]
MTKEIQIVIIDYPGALQSAVQGLKELFIFANQIIKTDALEQEFLIDIVQPETIQLADIKQASLIILPPNLGGSYYLCPEERLLALLCDAHKAGAIMCSACAGAFILARTSLLNGRTVTTHWQLADDFQKQFPGIPLKIESLLINDGDIISAGGLMSWIDLGLEIVAQFTKPHIMRSLGKFLIVDTGKREQRYYGSFTPRFDHGNQPVLQVQHHIQANYGQPVKMAELAALACMSERTFLRHFSEATGLKPLAYLQRFRIQKACELLESSSQSFEQISQQVGYEDVNSFRKLFIKVIGLTPTAFKERFAC